MKSIKILIVEDDLIFAMDLKSSMEGAGHVVTGIARDSKEAMKLVKNNPPELAIVDITLGMVEDAGIRIVKDILNQVWIPFIYLTGHTEGGMIEKATETEPASYLFKPFRPAELLIQVQLAYENFPKRPTPETVSQRSSDFFYFPSKNGHEQVKKDEILFLKAQGHCTDIYLTHEKTPHMIGTNLGTLVKYFTTDNFMRLSKSLFINLDHLKQIDRSHIYMGEGRVAVEISEANRKNLLKTIKVIRTK
ncbi:response regulator transcription factor [Dyadobacter sp. 32]|uniref:response regulator transcription factor n=1 Tax=Dyadobacter sp. 32 TaxID=538966 RepID=UPI0011F0369E